MINCVLDCNDVTFPLLVWQNDSSSTSGLSESLGTTDRDFSSASDTVEIFFFVSFDIRVEIIVRLLPYEETAYVSLGAYV